MKVPELLLAAAAAGLRLERHGDGLRVRGLDSLPEGLREAIRSHKREIVEAMRTPRDTAYAVWSEAVRRVGERWNGRFAGRPDAPWLDDRALQAQIAEAIRRGEVERTIELAAEWRRLWEEPPGCSSTSLPSGMRSSSECGR